MTRIDFAHGASHRLATACQVVYRHYLAGRKLVVYTGDTARLDRFDQLLWGFEPTAFVPHVHDHHALAAQSPIVLTSSNPGALATADQDAPIPWLLNLDVHCPPEVDLFKRVLEIVSDHEQDRQAARARWIAYREAGYELHAHQLARHAD